SIADDSPGRFGTESRTSSASRFPLPALDDAYVAPLPELRRVGPRRRLAMRVLRLCSRGDVVPLLFRGDVRGDAVLSQLRRQRIARDVRGENAARLSWLQEYHAARP